MTSISFLGSNHGIQVGNNHGSVTVHMPGKVGKWLVILDNVDDDQLLRTRNKGDSDPAIGGVSPSPSAKPLLEYIPRSQKGSVIITSRNTEFALRTVDHKEVVEVKPTEEPEALELLQRKLAQPEQSQARESRQLVNALEFMPLAIVQAASYIRNRAPRFTVSQYLKDLQGSETQATTLLQKEEPDHIYRDWEANNSILLAWEISFNHIRGIRKSAADLLSFMSFFDRQGIPENALRRSSDGKQPWLSRLRQSLLLTMRRGHHSYPDTEPKDVSCHGPFMVKKQMCTQNSPDGFEDGIQTLRNYSFGSVSQDSRFFDMHRLVQLATRWLESKGMLEWWKERYIQCLTENFPRGHFENWTTCQLLFPHVKSAFLQRPVRKDSNFQWAELLHNGAQYASQTRRFADAREMASTSMKTMEKLLGPKNKYTLESKSMLARAHWLEGNWEEAKKLYTQVHQCQKNKMGKNDTSLLTSMSNLASTYWSLGRRREAENLFTQVEIRKLKLGEDHPSTLTSMSNLAVTYACQGRLREAEKLEVRVLEGRKAILGENHPNTLTSMSNLAMTYGDQGRWEESEIFSVQVITMSNEILGEDHPSTLTSMANLGMVYGYQGRHEEAEKLGLQALKIREIKLGRDHPSTLTSMDNLVSLKRIQLRSVGCQTENLLRGLGSAL